MIRHAIAATVLAGWVLLFSPDPDDRNAEWRSVGRFPTDTICEYQRAAETQRAAEERIGGALASQPSDNPMRQAAYGRAYDRAQAQYRCVNQ